MKVIEIYEILYCKNSWNQLPGVSPEISGSFGFSIIDTRNLTTSTWPLQTATCNGVYPSGVEAFTFSVCGANISIIFVCPFCNRKGKVKLKWIMHSWNQLSPFFYFPRKFEILNLDIILTTYQYLGCKLNWSPSIWRWGIGNFASRYQKFHNIIMTIPKMIFSSNGHQ